MVCYNMWCKSYTIYTKGEKVKMAESKRYYWLKMQSGFFEDKHIKKLRKLAGGDTYTIIYLKMQLKSVMNGGVLTYTGFEPTFAEELALDIDEEPENVIVAVNYLLRCGLLEPSEDGKEFLLPSAAENIGSETEGAARVRKFRERQDQARLLQCNADVTDGLLQCNAREEREDNIQKIKNKEEKDQSGPPPLESLSYYMDAINPIPPSTVVSEMKDYIDELSDKVVLHAIQIAVGERKVGWNYIRAILRNYKAEGVKTMEDVLRREKEHQKKRNPGTKDPYATYYDDNPFEGWDE